MPILKFTKVISLYDAPFVTRKVSGCQVLFFIQMNKINPADSNDYFIAQRGCELSEETPEKVAEIICRLTYELMCMAEIHIDKTSNLEFVKKQIEHYKDELTFQ